MSLFGTMPSPMLVPEQTSTVLIQVFISPPFLSLSRRDNNALAPDGTPAAVDDFRVKKTQLTVQIAG